jgi:small subunit ribosomal protein S6
MHQYELMVILDPSVEEKTVEPSITKFLKVITAAKGTVDAMNIWGRRRLAYEIQKNTEGIYAVINMTAPSEAVIELDRQLNLSEAVMRTKVLRAEDVQFSITPIEYVAEKPSERPARKGPRKDSSDKPAPKRSEAKTDAPADAPAEAAAEVLETVAE